ATRESKFSTPSEDHLAEENDCRQDAVLGGLYPDTNLGWGARSQGGFLSNEPLRALVLDFKVAFLVDKNQLTKERAAALRGARFVLATKEEKLEGEVAAELGERVLLRAKDAAPWAAVYPRVRFVKDLQGAIDV